MVFLSNFVNNETMTVPIRVHLATREDYLDLICP